ncbi:methyltransferase domain-containing protein [uncultured Aquimarina sp.]|uniref:methyltransferase domain-containing protein n=1 Tax=uncultured Aquimarina sp. TaxID=575652 RepID=UPI0026196C2F|nr:methyltransferase domain-containing protein [uncultured Aquimarina sp.]
MNFSTRSHSTEQLDNLSLSGEVLLRTLSSLKFINKIFGNHKHLANSLLEYCLANPEKKLFHIIDLGCGGGDSIHYISKRLNENNIKTSFLGIDGNPQSIAYATSKYENNSTIKFKTDDILDEQFSIPKCDIIISSHFMYHFKNNDLSIFLKKAQQKGISHVIFSELRRSRFAYILFKYFSYIMPISSLAKKDGLVAIQRAFTSNELDFILNKSNVKNYSISKKHWFRTLTKIDL